MKKNSKKQTGSVKHDHPGRPRYTPRFPRAKEWTFNQFMEANDIETNPASKKFGKGPNCTMLTLRKFMARDAKKLARSLLFRVRGVTAEPNSKDGLGRRGYLYSLRAGVKAAKVVKAPKAKAPRKVKSAPAVNAETPKTHDAVSSATKTYEDIKAILATPSPAVTVPAVTIAPAPAPAPAPVEAPATSTLPVANLEPAAQ